MESLQTIQITPELLSCYMKLNKNAITLHLTMKALAQDGKLERNIRLFSKLMDRRPHRVREAEHELKRKQLLYIHWSGDRRFWYVYDRPVHQEAVPATTLAVATKVEQPLSEPQQSLWERIKSAFGVESLDYELTKS